MSKPPITLPPTGLDFDSDEERAEVIQGWVRKHGPAIITGVLLGLIAVFAWQQWQNHRAGVTAEASQHYAELVTALDTQRIDEAIALGATLRNEYTQSLYAALATLHLAAHYAADNNPQRAEALLRWSQDHGPDALRPVAQLRLARLLLVIGQLDQANTLIEAIQDPAWRAEVSHLRGDLLLAQGDAERARAAWREAQTTPGLENDPLLQIKIDAIGLEDN